MPNWWVIFSTGLLVGGLSCVAVQGGLLASVQVANAGNKKFRRMIMFLVSKVAAYTLLGLLLGWMGQKVQLSPSGRAVFQGLVAVYMMGVALALLEVHPFFRRFLLQTPKFLFRWIKKESRAEGLIVPAILGAATVLVPCGTTQAMMALALATGNPAAGAGVMLAFTLGTTPIFAALGMAVLTLGQTLKSRFNQVAAGILILLAGWSLNGALVLAGSPVTANSVAEKVACTISFCDRDQIAVTADEVVISITKSGYQTAQTAVKADSKVKIKLVNTDGYGCQQAFTIPSLNISEVIKPGEEKEMEIEVPEKPGRLAFSCGMGMYSGYLTIVE
jgi:sulfite exporter TauE/SafE